MVVEGCTCSWGIPGVDRLPAHDHWFQDDLRVWVDWRAVARALSTPGVPA